MRGVVRQPASLIDQGIIEGEDGHLYRYTPDDLQHSMAATGAVVIFYPEGREAREVEIEPSEHEALLSDKGRNWLAFYLSPHGRVSRRDFWLLGMLPIGGMNVVIRSADLPLIVIVALLALSSWALIALSFRRSQDVGLTGWWSLLPWFALTLWVIVPDIFDQASTVGAAIPILMTVATVLAYLSVVFGIFTRSGQPEPNRYGPSVS